MSDDRIALGKSGEDLACRELERRGYAIVARRYRRRGGELDIVARDGKTTVFVEVKTRQGDRFGAGVEAVHGLKRRRMMQLALDYIMRHRLADSPCRFDVVSIQVDDGRTGGRSISERVRHVLVGPSYRIVTRGDGWCVAGKPSALDIDFVVRSGPQFVQPCLSFVKIPSRAAGWSSLPSVASVRAISDWSTSRWRATATARFAPGART